MPFRLRGTPAWFFSIPAGTPQDWLPSLRDSRNFFQLCPHSISAGFPRRDSRHPHFCAHFYSELHTILRPDWLYRPPEYKQAQSESSQDAPDLCWLSSLCTFCCLFLCLLFGSLVFHAFLLSASTFFCIFFCIILAFLSAFFSVTSFVCYLESTSIFLCGEAVITHACPALRFLPGWFELRCSFVGTRIISLNEGDAACESLIDGLVTGDKATAILILGVLLAADSDALVTGGGFTGSCSPDVTAPLAANPVLCLLDLSQQHLKQLKHIMYQHYKLHSWKVYLEIDSQYLITWGLHSKLYYIYLV